MTHCGTNQLSVLGTLIDFVASSSMCETPYRNKDMTIVLKY